MRRAHASVSPQPQPVNATNQSLEGTVMTITTEILDSIERACPVAPIWTLTHYIVEIREGMAHANAEVSAHNAAEYAARIDHPQRPRPAHREVADARPKDRDKQYRPPPKPVGKGSPYRCQDKLHQRIHRNQQPHVQRRRLKLFRIEGEHRDHDPKPNEVNKDRDENDDQRRGKKLVARSLERSCGGFVLVH